MEGGRRGRNKVRYRKRLHLLSQAVEAFNWKPDTWWWRLAPLSATRTSFINVVVIAQCLLCRGFCVSHAAGEKADRFCCTYSWADKKKKKKKISKSGVHQCRRHRTVFTIPREKRPNRFCCTYSGADFFFLIPPTPPPPPSTPPPPKKTHTPQRINCTKITTLHNDPLRHSKTGTSVS